MNVIQRKERLIEVIRFKRYRGKRKKNGDSHRKKVRDRQKKYEIEMIGINKKKQKIK